MFKDLPMTVKNITADGIRKAAEIIRRKRPAYTAMIDFYVNVFVAQQFQIAHLTPPAPGTKREIFARRQNDGQPLMDPSQFWIDRNAARFLFNEIVGFAAQTDAPVAADAKRLQQRMQADEEGFENLLTIFEGSDDKCLQDAAARLGIGQQRLLLFLYHSIRPSLVKGAEAISMYLDRKPVRGNGCCPVCGTPAALSVLDFDGRRFLICGYCWLHWRTQRMFCPSCEQNQPAAAAYLTIDEEPEYRIDLCADCRTYVKTVDARKLDRPLYPPLEALCTLHLDMKAQEAGYAAPVGPCGI